MKRLQLGRLTASVPAVAKRSESSARAKTPSVGTPIGAPSPIVIDMPFVAPTHPLASVALIVKLNIPLASGVPVIAPVAGLRVSPFGNAPALTA